MWVIDPPQQTKLVMTTVLRVRGLKIQLGEAKGKKGLPLHPYSLHLTRIMPLISQVPLTPRTAHRRFSHLSALLDLVKVYVQQKCTSVFIKRHIECSQQCC
jgi:hypothetical protein